MSRLSVRSPKCHRNLQPRSATRKWLHVALPDDAGHWRWQCWLQPRALRRGCGQGKKNGQQLGLGNNRNTEAPAPGLVLAGRIQYRPHSYNHTLTMGLVWAGSELRTLAPWPPATTLHINHEFLSPVASIQTPVIVNKTCKYSVYSAPISHHCMGLIRCIHFTCLHE